MKVDFFIAGPPRCASTSLSYLLDCDERVCFARPKEPTYFCSDITAGDRDRARNEDDYHRQYFSHYDAGKYEIAGEGTPLYLMSHTAMQAIKAYNPQAKIIALARNPVEIVTSMHATRVRVGPRHENIVDFKEAWDAQAERLKGEKLPEAPVIREAVLQYRELGSIGSQYKRMFEVFDRSQVHVIVYEDLIETPKKTLEEMYQFLGLAVTSELALPRKEIGTEWKSDRSRVMMNSLRRVVSKLPWKPQMGIMRSLKKSQLQAKVESAVSPEIDIELRNEFREEVILLEKLLGRDFTHWK